MRILPTFRHSITRQSSNGIIDWQTSTILFPDSTISAASYYTETLKVLYASDDLVLSLGVIAKGQDPAYPILYSIDGGQTFQPLADLSHFRSLREIAYDSTDSFLWAASSVNGTILRFDLSTCVGADTASCKPSYVSAPLLPLTLEPRIYGLAVSPDGQTLIAISQRGEAYYLTDAAGISPASGAWCASASACSATLSPQGEGFTGEVWTAQFLTDSIAMLVGRNSLNSATSPMVFLSANAGQSWAPVPIAAQDWSVVQAPLTGRYFPDDAALVAPQGTLRLAGATITTHAPLAALTPALILGGTGVLGEPGVTIDTAGSDSLVLISTLSGTGTLTKTGTGTLLLRPVPPFNPDEPGGPTVPVGNYHSGGTIVRGGVLNIATDAALGAPSANDTPKFNDLFYYPAPACIGATCKYALTLDGGTLQAANDLLLSTSWLERDATRKTLDRQIVLGNAGGSIDTNGYTVTVPGTISGAGDLTKIGLGVLLLAGQNTYLGSTAVQAGVLRLGIGNALPVTTDIAVAAGAILDMAGHDQALGALNGAGLVSLGSGTLTVGTGDRTGLFTGSIGGNGGLIKLGAGAQGLAGATVIGGTIQVQQGDLSVDGTVSASAVTVMPQGTLSGSGLIAAPTSVLGTLRPGDSPGTLSFTAPVTLSPTATLAIVIDGAGEAGRVAVQGAGFTAAGLLAPVLLAGAPPLGQAVPVVQADGGISGSFAALAQPGTGLAPGTRFDALYQGGTLALVVTPAAFGALAPLGVPVTATQIAVGGVLDAIRPAAGVRMDGSAAAIFSPLYQSPAASLPVDLDTMAGTIYGDEIMMALSAQRLLMDGISGQIDGWHDGPRDAVPRTLTGWTTSAGQFGQTASAGAPGFSATTAAVTVGADAAPRPDMLIGMAVGYAGTGVSSDTYASAQTTMVRGAVYGAWQSDHLFVDLQMGGGGTDSTANRTVLPYGAEVHGVNAGWVFGGLLRAGVLVPVQSWRLLPTVGIDVDHAGRGSLAETGDPNLALLVGSGAARGYRGTVGIRATTDIATPSGVRLRPNLDVAWAHELGATTANTTAAFAAAPATPFSVSSAPASRDMALIGASLDVVLGMNVVAYGRVAVALGGPSTSQSVTGGLRVVW